MMVGNASAGVIVVLASVVTRLAAGGGGDPTTEQLGVAAKLFFGLQVVLAMASIVLYVLLVRRSPRLAAAVDPAGAAAAAVHVPSTATNTSTIVPEPETRSPTTTTAATALRERLVGLGLAARAVWLPATCQALTFGVTLAAWPSIPGAACPAGDFEQWSSGWWFTLVVATYNVLDMGARLHLRGLQAVAAHMSPRACLAACVARILLVPLIYACVSPHLLAGGGGNVVILLGTALLALSNGLLATASMMQVARLAPPGLGEEGVYVAVAGVYLGLASGASISWVMARDVLEVGEMNCSGV